MICISYTYSLIIQYFVVILQKNRINRIKFFKDEEKFSFRCLDDSIVNKRTVDGRTAKVGGTK